MRLIISVLSFIFILALPWVEAKGAAADDPQSATIGFIPSEDPEILKKNGVEIAKKLQEKLGVPVNIYVSKNYSGLIDAMKEKKIDFAFLTAATFVFAEKEAGAKVLLKKVWAGPYYWSTIVTRKASKIKNLRDLKGKRVGFVDEKSASGYLYPRAAFIKKGLNPDKDFSEVKFFGNHEATIKALFGGLADAVAVYADDSKGKLGAWTEYATAEQSKQIQSLWVSDPIPNDPFCVRQDFYEKHPRFVHDLMFTLIEMGDEPDSKHSLKKLLGMTTLSTATSKQYEPVRDLVKSLNLKLQ